MSGIGQLLVFAGVMALGQFSPGPDLLLVTRTALRKGTAAGMATVAGITLGLAVHASLAVAGVAVVFNKLPTLALAMRWVAATYLLWIAWALLRDCWAALRSGTTPGAASPTSEHPPFVQGLICNLTNPKVALLLMAVSAPFLSGPHPPWWPAAIWMLIVFEGMAIWAAWVMLLQWRPLRATYERAMHWIDLAFAAVLAGLAAKLVLGG